MATKRQRRRRGAGEGAVFKRAARGGKPWVGVLSLPAEPGKPRRRRTIYGTTQAEVVSKMEELRGHRRDNKLVDPSLMLVSELLDRWLASPGRNPDRPRRESSRLVYGYQLAHVRKHIGPVRVQRLTALHVHDMIAEWQRAGVPPYTRRLAFKALRAALTWGVARGFVATNATDRVDSPAGKPRPKTHAMLDGVTADGELEYRVLLDHADRDESYIGPLVHLLLASGARMGECIALRWQDLDLRAGRLSISRTVSDGSGDGLVFAPPKSAAGERVVSLTQRCTQTLARWRTRQGTIPHPGSLVFPNNVDGGPLRRSGVSRAWHRLLRDAKLPKRNPHSLRHLCASLLIAKGLPVTDVAEILGQDLRTLLATYAHAMKKPDRESVKVLDKVLG